MSHLGRILEAIISYEKAIQYEPANSSAWSNRGNLLSDLEREEEAISSYENAITHQLNKVQAWDGLGASLYKLGQY